MISLKNYDNFLTYLCSLKDEKFLNFHTKLVSSKYEIIGIRTPLLKGMAKEVALNNFDEYMKKCSFSYYEEIFLYGLILGYSKKSYTELRPYLNLFLKHLDNWAICDGVVANLKQVKKEKTVFLDYIKELVNSKYQFEVRFGLILLLDYYIEKDYLETIFKICDSLNREEYYIKMAVAWLISICYIKFKNETLTYLNNSSLDKWTFNKAVQKIIESKRINKEEKEFLKSLKR